MANGMRGSMPYWLFSREAEPMEMAIKPLKEPIPCQYPSFRTASPNLDSIEQSAHRQTLFQRHQYFNLLYTMTEQQKPLHSTDTPPTKVPVRLEVDVWWTSKEQIHVDQQLLFIDALLRFQNKSPGDPFSYFQIAGIHGQPWVPWKESAKPATPYRGYCTHGSILFPTWHRPYMLLYESTLQEIMLNETIPAWPDKDGIHARFIAAAKEWRLPYWDWAEKKPDSNDNMTYLLPKIVLLSQLSMMSPVGPIKVRNPMYKFVMPGNTPMGTYGVHHYSEPNKGPYDYSAPYEAAWGTSRWVEVPPSDTSQANIPLDFKEGFQDNASVNKALQGHDWYQNKSKNPPRYPDTVGEAVYRFFSQNYFSAYEKFATAAHDNSQPPPDYLSIESVHNNIHNWTGGEGQNDKGVSLDGHMTEPPVSAFDPIFWMHHANIDRQFAIWQELWPNAWFDGTKETDKDGTYSIPKGTVDSPKVLLRPFNDPQNVAYTSDMIRDWYAMGYSYTELQPWDPIYSPGGKYDRSLYIKDLNQKMTKLYSSTRDLWLQHGENIGSGTDEYDEDYVINVIYDKFELCGKPYTIHLYLGKDQVGSVYNFSAQYPEEGTGSCENCNRQRVSKQLFTGQVPITSPLIKGVQNPDIQDLPAINEEDVRTWLTKHLNWRVTVKGHEVPLSEMKSLKVAVAAGKAHHYEDDDKMSRYYGYEYLFGITEGKERGATPADSDLLATGGQGTT